MRLTRSGSRPAARDYRLVGLAGSPHDPAAESIHRRGRTGDRRGGGSAGSRLLRRRPASHARNGSGPTCPGPGTATCLIPGLLPEIPAYTVKVNAKFPASSPALRGVVCLHDLNTGELLALADSASVTAWRTGLSAALATHVLADPTARTLGFVGAGAQARMVAAGLRTLRSFDQTVATDLNPSRAADLADVVVDDARAVAARCDVVILATWSRVPLLHAEDIPTGTHLTTLGADEPGKIELGGRRAAAQPCRCRRRRTRRLSVAGPRPRDRVQAGRRPAGQPGCPRAAPGSRRGCPRRGARRVAARAGRGVWLARVDRDVLGGLRPEAARLGEALNCAAAAAADHPAGPGSPPASRPGR